MNTQPIAIQRVGLVTSVGLSAPAACAAFRAKISNATATHFIGADGEWIVAHQVPLERPWQGINKLCKMVHLAIKECLEDFPLRIGSQLPLLLCVAESERPGRLEKLDTRLFRETERQVQITFSPHSATFSDGHVSVPLALARARQLIYEHDVPFVLLAASDSLLDWDTLRHYANNDRLLSTDNSDGFIAGEGAGALLVAKPCGNTELVCCGIGFGFEEAGIESSAPLRADGLMLAITNALTDANCDIYSIDARIGDLSGEQYYFKEAALALGRLLHKRTQTPDIWHPAECVGESGALAGITIIALADAACRKGYSPGPLVLAHMGNDSGKRAAIVLQWSDSGKS